MTATKLLPALLLLSCFAFAADNTTATVYVYRYHPKETWGHWKGSPDTVKLPITVDNTEVAHLRGQRYVVLTLRAGIHDFGINKVKHAPTKVIVEAGNTYFVRLDTGGTWAAYGIYQVLTEAEAMPELQQLKHQTDHVDVPLWLTAAH